MGEIESESERVILKVSRGWKSRSQSVKKTAILKRSESESESGKLKMKLKMKMKMKMRLSVGE
jgi:hypothetical protein